MPANPDNQLWIEPLQGLNAARQRKEQCVTSGECLPLAVVGSDGGEFASDYCCNNMLVDDCTCYCSAKSRDINVLLGLRQQEPFTVTQVSIRAPSMGYTSPLGQAVIFICWDIPNLERCRAYDNVRSCQDYQRLLRQQLLLKGELDDHDAVLFVDMGDAFSTSVVLDVPRTGRYVLVKLLRPRCPYGDNVDVQYMGFQGWRGVRGFSCASVC